MLCTSENKLIKFVPKKNLGLIAFFLDAQAKANLFPKPTRNFSVISPFPSSWRWLVLASLLRKCLHRRASSILCLEPLFTSFEPPGRKYFPNYVCQLFWPPFWLRLMQGDKCILPMGVPRDATYFGQNKRCDPKRIRTQSSPTKWHSIFYISRRQVWSSSFVP